jgi:hypothetical protein
MGNIVFGNDALPENLKYKRHDDYPYPFKYIPRAWTAFKVDWPPVVLIGNMKPKQQVCGWYCPDPIGKPGQWSIQGIKLFKWLPYIALFFTVTTPFKWGWLGAWHFSVWVRADTSDAYFQAFRFAITRNRE